MFMVKYIPLNSKKIILGKESLQKKKLLKKITNEMKGRIDAIFVANQIK
jgi:hypothetical protein